MAVAYAGPGRYSLEDALFGIAFGTPWVIRGVLVAAVVVGLRETSWCAARKRRLRAASGT